MRSIEPVNQGKPILSAGHTHPDYVNPDSAEWAKKTAIDQKNLDSGAFGAIDRIKIIQRKPDGTLAPTILVRTEGTRGKIRPVGLAVNDPQLVVDIGEPGVDAQNFTEQAARFFIVLGFERRHPLFIKFIEIALHGYPVLTKWSVRCSDCKKSITPRYDMSMKNKEMHYVFL